MRRALVFFVAVVTAARVYAQTAAPEPPVPLPPVTPAAPVPAPLPPVPTPPPVTLEPTEVTLTPVVADAATCLALDTTPGALMEPVAASGGLDTPVPWTEFVVDGTLLESSDAVRTLLEPTMQQYRTTLSNSTWPQIAAVITKFGYQLVGHVVVTVPKGERLELHLAPLPIVRKVSVSVSAPGAFLRGLFEPFQDDEVKRRLSVRTGSYLPWEPIRRKCALAEETKRIEDYLFDEGYAEATVRIVPDSEGNIVRLHVKVDLGKVYNIGKITITPPPGGEQLAISDETIKAVFHHSCYVQRCRFTRTQHQEDLQKVKRLFHKRGYPAVRVQSSFDPHTSFDRHTHTVPITLTIDQRRAIDVQFEGNDRDAVPDDQLRDKLTFDTAGSSDDVEAAASAKAIEGFLQTRGYFDARVTVERQRQPEFDKIIFHIDQGPTREVRDVQFAGNTQSIMSTSKLEGVVTTKAAGSILSVNAAATSEQIKLDVERIKEAYRRAGYRETRVHASASTEPGGLGDAALTAALLLADAGSGSLYVRYRIEEGPPSLLTRIQVDLTGPKETHLKLCDQLLHELATELAEPQLAKRTPDPTAPDACIATASNANFREDDVNATRDRLRDFLFKNGRPRASVDYEARELGQRHWLAHYTVRGADELRVGKVVIRGNFRTKAWIIKHELRLHEGDPLTTAALADGARRLRNTGLFDAVNIDLPDLCTNPPTCDAGSNIVDAVVRVEERYDYLSALEGDVGYSSYNEFYGTLKGTVGNLLGRGVRLTGLLTYGQKIFDAEGTIVFPPWLVPDWVPFDFRTEVTGLYERQDTPRFGQLTTEGFSVGFTSLPKLLQRQRTDDQDARVITVSPHYDYRFRTRQVDALRAIGTDQDDSQLAIGTRTGSFGVTFDWEQRVDRHGVLAPLAPDGGFRFNASASFASPDLGGQDTFIKVSATGSRFITIGQNLLLRGDLRYDQGIPLGGAVLLPEVERFFAGGDNTVRGYADDRMATEIVQVGVPPIAGLQQIRVIPAGGNIRALSSLDAQLRIWSVLAAAAFTDAGIITNQWSTVTADDVRPSVGMGVRALTPFGIAALEYAVPLNPQIGDDPRGRIHFYFAARAQF